MSASTFCSVCRAPNEPTYAFCVNCGARLTPPAPGGPPAPPSGYPAPPPAPYPYAYPPPYPYYPGPPPPRASFSDMMSGMFHVWTKNFLNFFIVYIVLALVTGALGAVVSLAILGTLATGGGILPGSSAPGGAGLGALLLYAVLSLALSVILNSIVAGGMTEYAVRRLRGEPMTLQQALRRGLERFLSILGASTLLTLIVFALVGLPLLLLIPVMVFGGGNPATVLVAVCGLALTLVIGGVVAIWLTISLSLYAPAIMMENAKAIDGLSRSWRITKGYKWSIFGAGLLTEILVGVITAAFVVPAIFARNPVVSILAAALASGIAGPLLVILTAVAYDLILRAPAASFGGPPAYTAPSYTYAGPYVPPSPPSPPPQSPPTGPPQSP